MNKCLYFQILCLWTSFIYGQNTFKFARHLESLGYYDEGILFVENLIENSSANVGLDSLYYQKGRFEYFLRKKEASIRSFERISLKSTWWNAANFYTGLQYAYVKKYEIAATKFKEPKNINVNDRELQKISLAGVALLERNHKKFETLQSEFDSSNVQFKTYQDGLSWVNNELKTHKKKSKVVAGLMSAVIPGSGKIYNGLLGQGAISLITNTVFALQAYEGYRNDGPKSVRFILFTGLFSVFHVANVWGSVISIDTKEDSFNESMNEKILVNIHVPIRLLYK